MLIGGDGVNLLDGGTGNDVYDVSDSLSARNAIRDVSGNDTLRYNSSVLLSQLHATITGQADLQIADQSSRSVLIENQFGGDSATIEHLTAQDGTFNLNLSAEQLISSGQFEQMHINGGFNTESNITNQHILSLSDQLQNNHLLSNEGQLNINADAHVDNRGTLDNDGGVIEYAGSSTLGGTVVNNGIIRITNDALLSLTGELYGSGQFDGDTYLLDATLSPGNSPGTLSFFGDTLWDNVSLNLEFGVAPDGGFLFDKIFIDGGLTLMSSINLNVSFLDGLSWEDLVGHTFDFFELTGELRDGFGSSIADIASWFSFSVDGPNVVLSDSGWRLEVENIGDKVSEVSAPTTLGLLLGSMGLLCLSRRKHLKR